MRKFLLIAAAILGYAGYLVFSSPNELAIDAQGNPKGDINWLRSEIQGTQFWKHQLNLLDAKIADLQKPLNLPSAEDMQKISKESDQMMENLYSQMPEMRPSKAALEAQRLREKADQIESDEMIKVMEEATKNHIQSLIQLRPLLVKRASTEQGAAANP